MSRKAEEGDGSKDPNAEEDEGDFDFVKALDEAKSKPCAINDLVIVGNHKTKRKIIERELQQVKKAKNLEEILLTLNTALEELEALGIFKSVDATVDAGPVHLPNTADITLVVDESAGYGLQSGVFVQGSEATAEVSGSLKNALGYAEEFDLTFSKSNLGSGNKYSFSWLDSRFLGTRSQLQTQIFRRSQSYRHFSSYSENSTGLGADWLSPDGKHKIGYELAWRELFCGNQMLRRSGGGGGSNEILASKEVLQQAGHSMKSSIKHTMLLDGRDVVGMMSNGLAFQMTTEVSGIGLDPRLTRFVREEVEVVSETPLTIFKQLETSLELRLRGGLLLPWGTSAWEKPTYISDRFFLGGTGSLRGFHIKGAGPTGKRRGEDDAEDDESSTTSSNANAKRDALGGDVMFSASAALKFEIPYAKALKDLGIYGQVFGDAGNCVGLTGYALDSVKSTFRDLTSRARATFGVGLVWPSPIGNLEANYCVVKKAQVHDKWRNGFHFGFSTSGLVRK